MSDVDVGNLNAEEFLDNVLGDDEAEQHDGGRLPPVDEAPASTGGYQPLIEKRRRELTALEDKLLNHRKTGAYIAKYDNGQEYFDQIAMSEDNVRINKLTREIAEFEAKERRAGEERSRRNATANGVASALLKREIPKLPEGLQKPVTEAFIAIYQGLTGAGREWTKPVYADKGKIAEALQQVLDTAVGNATRKQWGGSAPTGDPAAPPREKPEENDEDDFTNNLMYAFERRQRTSMTVAEAKAAARAAAEKGGNS